MNNPTIFYSSLSRRRLDRALRNTWSLRSLARCLTDELGIPIIIKHLQRITKDMGIRCKRPKLELLHGSDYEEGKDRVEKKVMLVFDDETTITQKPCIRKSMSFEGKQLKIEHNGSRNKFSVYISMLWPDQKLMLTYDSYYDFHIGKTYLIHLTLFLNEKDIHFLKGNSYHRTISEEDIY